MRKIKIAAAGMVCLAAGWFAFSKISNQKIPLKSSEVFQKIPLQDRMDLAMEHERLMTLDPTTSTVPRERLLTARDYQLRQFDDQALINAPVTGVSWVQRGPNNVGGRTRALIYDLNDATRKKVWAGSVGGGIWFCTDITLAAPVWTKVNDLAPNLAVTAIAQHPTAPLTMYYGTGEGWFNTDAIRGLGIWKSTNGGTTWAQLASTNNSNFHYVQKMAVKSTGVVFASTRNAGLQRSTDGGVTWTKVLGAAVGGGNNDRAADVEIASDGTVYASLGIFSTGQIFKSVNDGATWTNITPAGTWQRIELATSPSTVARVYALLQGTGNGIGGIRRTDNAGVTWTSLPLPSWCDQGAASTDFTRTQCWYDLICAVDPLNSNNVFIGGVDILKSTNAGAAWTQVTQWASGCGVLPSIHADIHAITFKPATSTEFITGTDGGIYRTTNTGVAFTARNTGYNVTQFYASAIHPTTVNYFLAGAQDNGTQKFTLAGLGNTTMATGGDGAFCHIDKTNGNIQITSYVFNNYWVSINGGTTWTTRFFANTGQFINPTDYDNTADKLYGGAPAGNYFRWTDPATAGGTAAYVNVTNFAGSSITHVKVSPNVANRVYFGLANGSIVYVNTAATVASPTAGVIVKPAFAGTVSSIAVQPGNESHILVTYSNYGVNSVWETLNGGTTWTSVEGNLPDMPIRYIMYDPRNALGDQALVATELGVWSTDNLNGALTNWGATNTGFANVRTDMLQYRCSDRTISAATHGRGMYTAVLPVFAGGLTCPNNAFSRPEPVTAGIRQPTGSFSVQVQSQSIIINAANTGNQEFRLVVTDGNGRLVNRSQMQQRATVNLSGRAKGVYFINIYDQQNKIVHSQKVLN
jgi:trimeric autotransporter adhesin